MKLIWVEAQTSGNEELVGALEQRGWTVIRRTTKDPTCPNAHRGEIVASLLDGRAPTLELARAIQGLRSQYAPAPVFVLSSLETDLRALIQAGASDFVLPPHSATEVDLRIRVRTEPPTRLILGTCTVDLQTGNATWPNETFSLTGTEVKLLTHNWNRADRVVSREDLLVAVWGYHRAVDTRAVALAVSRLRRKIEAEPDHPVYFQTVYGVGYRLVLCPERENGERISPFALPARAGALYGRNQALVEVCAALTGEARLFVLHGPGGIGKTRIAIAVGHELSARQHSHSEKLEILYCDLSDHESMSMVLLTLGRCVGLKNATPVGESPSDPGYIQRYHEIGRALTHRRVLIILDNFEQVALQANTLLTVLTTSPSVRVLLTSRICIVHPLAQHLTLLGLDLEPGRKLFLARALAIRPEFVLEQREEELLDEVVGHLDGVPLAIEIAASRVQLLSLDQIWQRLSTRFDWHNSPDLGSSRHRTLHQILDDSWKLLSPDLQQTLASCGVFRGGFSLEAAEAVLTPHPSPALERLQMLVSHSLVQIGSTSSGFRCYLMESVQLYLEHKTDVYEARAAHLRHFLKVTRQVAQDAMGTEPVSAMAWFEIERHNILAAFHFACEDDPEVAAELVLDLCQLYWMQGDAGALRLLEQIPSGISTIGRLRIDVQRSRFWMRQGKWSESHRLASEVLEQAIHNEHLEIRVLALQLLAYSELEQGEIQSALAKSKPILDMLETLGLRRLKSVHLVKMSNGFRLLGRSREALAAQQEALEIAQSEGALWNEMLVCGHLSLVQHQLGDLDGAIATARPQVEFYQASGDRRNEIMTLLNLVMFYLDAGDQKASREQLRDVAPLVNKFGSEMDVAFFHCLLCRLGIEEQDFERARHFADLVLSSCGEVRSRVVSHVWSLQMWIEHFEARHDLALQSLHTAKASYEALKNPIEVGKLRLREATLLADARLPEAASAWESGCNLLFPFEQTSTEANLIISAIHLKALNLHPHIPEPILVECNVANLTQLATKAKAAEVRWASRLASRSLSSRT